ncbi:hypothetical protein NL676_039412 [Syzygium grande]|nr:hypothetical protein NL676_039412 [Syzygium grande]
MPSAQYPNDVGPVKAPKSLYGSGGQQQWIRAIRHESYPEHPLCFLPSPPYNGGEFMCNACGNNAHYMRERRGHVLLPLHDLHPECAELAGSTTEGCWCYYCTGYDYRTHMGRVEAEAVEASEDNGGDETEDNRAYEDGVSPPQKNAVHAC